MTLIHFSVERSQTLMNAGFQRERRVVVFHKYFRLPQNVVPPPGNELLTHLAVVDTKETVEPDDFHH